MSEKITIFKEVFNYYYDGEITKEQFADLMLLHYQVMWGDGVDIKDIQDKEVRMIWRTLQHTVKKSAKNAKDYDKRKQNKENENKPVLTPQINEDDNLYQPEADMPSNGLKTAKNEEFEKDLKQTVIETSKNNDNMGNFSGYIINNNQIEKVQETTNVTSNESSNIELGMNDKIQDWLNADDNNIKLYNRLIETIANYKLNPDSITYNSKEMAMNRIGCICNEIDLNYDEFIDYINEDVEYIVSTTAA